jgi:hypothetical protein
MLFQVIAERAEKAAIIVTTNLPFCEWPRVFTNAPLYKALLDRLTDQAHFIETDSESYRFRGTLGKKSKKYPGGFAPFSFLFACGRPNCREVRQLSPTASKPDCFWLW